MRGLARRCTTLPPREIHPPPAIGDKDFLRREDLRRDWRGMRRFFLLRRTEGTGQQRHRQTETKDGCFQMLRHYSSRHGTRPKWRHRRRPILAACAASLYKTLRLQAYVSEPLISLPSFTPAFFPRPRRGTDGKFPSLKAPIVMSQTRRGKQISGNVPCPEFPPSAWANYW